MSNFTEATRVQIPAMVHLTRLGYTYFGKISEQEKGNVYDGDTNILIPIFRQQFEKLNPEYKDQFGDIFRSIKKELNDDDLGRGFYGRLKSVSPTKLIDYDNIGNNVFHFTGEFTCKNGEEEFRPDITLFVNGLPLCFIEVKKPNNHEGMKAELDRIEKRFSNKKFRRFINITQLMVFSNNMEYDTLGNGLPLQGAFYCTGARESTHFNCFREENPECQEIAPFYQEYPYKDIDKEVEKSILTDYNCQVILSSPEYKTNIGYNTPTNRILTSMCSPERLLYILRYSIAYVRSDREVDGKIVSTDEKHIMRYQQLFATLSIRKKLSEGVKSGIIWHTQGSGKTALAYFLTYILNDFYSKQNKVTKFYFIVDRLDLLEQAKQEFDARGLFVTTADTKEELMEQFKTNQAQQGVGGQAEITVVNIQRFSEDRGKVNLNAYATNLQRIFILDEAHRSYRPGGCFLANLFDADQDSIKIALTGTPLLKEERASCTVFGNYLHTYYYDKSIADGYTLKIIREDIETSYKEKLSNIKDNLDKLVQMRQVKKSDIVEHPNYVEALAHYIISDLKEFRLRHGDNSIGGMVICETSNQAKNLFNVFHEEEQNSSNNNPLKAGLILYDVDDKETRKQIIKNFKKNMTIDILIVYNMLLTGFDAPRLKRLYLGRELKDHTLLQAITRVNRPYKNMRYGFLIDFADIKRNFEETNRAYLRELNRFNNPDETGEGKTIDTFAQVIEDKDEILRQMKDIQQTLFDYTYDNAETFSTEISIIDDKTKLLNLKKALSEAKDLSNLVRTFGDDDLKASFSKLELTKLPELLSEVRHRMDILNQKEAFSSDSEIKVLINEAMLDIEFNFSKIGREELRIISGGKELQEKWRRTIDMFTHNYDQDDPEYITLREAFMCRFKDHGFVIDSIAKYNEENKALDDICKKLKEIQTKDNALTAKYKGDFKFTRVHKRIREENEKRKRQEKKPIFSYSDQDILDILNSIKRDIDNQIYNRNDILKKDTYFNQTVMTLITQRLNSYPKIKAEVDDYNFVQSKISQQYLNQYNAI